MYTKKNKIIGAMLAIIMLMQIFCSSITSVVLAAETTNNMEVTFVDENLYSAIKEQIKSKLSSYSDKDKTIIISNANIETITSLDLSKKEIRSLSGLENFTGLTKLDLTSNKLKKIDELGSLTKLEELTLANNNLEDCTVLESLPNLNEERITLGSQNLEKTVAVNSEDINEYSFTYVLPQIFKYIQKIKTANGEKMDMALTIKYVQGEGLADNGQYTLNEETFELIVENVKKQGLATIEIRYDSKTGQDTTLLLNLLAVPDDKKLGIVFEDEKLYRAVKTNIEGTTENAYLDSKYPIIRDDNEGCVWYDAILSLVINRHYLYKDIVDLDLVNKQIENLEGLQYFVGLSDLDLSNNFISDVSVIEKLGNQKVEAEKDLKAKVKEIYDELIKNINKKEEALSLLTPSGRKKEIESVVKELDTNISNLANKEGASEEIKNIVSNVKNYFINSIKADSLYSKNIETPNNNVTNLLNGGLATIGTKTFNSNNSEVKKDCVAQVRENELYYKIPTTGESLENTIDIDDTVRDYIFDCFRSIQRINMGYCEVNGDFIKVTDVLNSVVKEIEKNIEELEKYIDIENLLLVLPKETLEKTEADIESLSLSNTEALALEIINSVKSSLSKLTVEEISVAFGVTITNIDTVDEYNKYIDKIIVKMNNDLASITNEEDEGYIGDNKYELENLIFEYIAYQKSIVQSHNILDGIDLGYKKQILPSEIMEYTDTELYDLSLAGAKRLALEALEAFIEEYKKGELTDVEEYIKGFPTQAKMEEVYKLIQNGSSGYTTKNNLVEVIKEYRKYQNILLKEVVDLSEVELRSLTYDKAKSVALEILRRYLEEYDTLTGLTVTKETIEKLYDDVENSTLNGGGLYGSVEGIERYVITEYKKHEARIDNVFVENFIYTNGVYVNYSKYIKEALMEADTSNNYMETDTDEINRKGDKYKLDRSDVKNIISRFKGINFDAVITLPKTKVINLSSNNLTDISKLTNIPTLEKLYVSDNVIRDLSLTDFTKFEKLNTLDLSHNRIYETKIGLMPNLENLNLSYNYIEKIDGMGLSAFTKLQSINLAGNRIYDLQPIMYNLYQIAKVQEKNKVLPIVTWTNTDGIFASWTDLKEFGYVASKAKVNFEGQTIYASVPEKILQGVDEYVKLPAIFNQVKYIDCGETNFLNAKATNDGMIMYLDTSVLGERTDAAEIEGTGVATGTKCYVTYTVATEDEVNKVLIEGIDIQIEKELSDNENDTMPDIDRDGDVDGDDLAILNNTGINLTDEQMKIAKNIVPDDVYSASDRVLLKKYIEEKVEWTEKALTAAIKAKAEVASMTGKDKPSNDDLLILAKYIMSGSTSSYTVEQLLEKLDLTGDKQLTALDAMYLTKYLAITSTEKESVETIDLKMIGNYKETKQLYALITPDDADPDQKEIVWRTSNQGAVTVDKNGIITAVGQGNAIITAASTKNSQVYDTVFVTVGEAVDVVDSIVMTEETRDKLARDYYLGEKLDLTNCKLEISRISGKTETVDIKPEMLEGFTTENITTEPTYVKVKYEGQETGFNMNVLDWPDNRATLTKDNFDDYLNVTVPTDAVYNGTEYLAEVAADENKKIGTITVKYVDEAGNDVEKPVNAGTYKVLVDITDGVDLNPATDVEVGTFKIAQAELPEEQRPDIDTEYTVEKGGDFVVAVENGIITKPEGTTFDKVGTTNVTLTFVPNDTNYKAIDIPVKVNVVISVKGVKLNKSEYIVVKGATNASLNATVMPAEATNKNVIWSSSDETIVKVDDTGKLTPISVGEVTITVTTKDGGKSTTCKVIVKEQVYSPKELAGGTVAITGINPETTEEYFRNKFLSENTYKIFKADGKTELSKTDTIATGYVLKVYDANGTVVEEQILVVKGDTNGDGKASATDSGAILAHRTGKKALVNEYLLAADINNDGEVDGRDSTLLIYHRIGMAGYILQNN